MAERIFVDTGAFYARYVARDDYHDEAVERWRRIAKDGVRCATTNLVVAELATLLAYRFGAASAVKAAREIYASQAIGIVRSAEDLEFAALDWMERFSDQKFSFTDAVSFALMRRERLAIAFTFDRHFDIAGFRRFL